MMKFNSRLVNIVAMLLLVLTICSTSNVKAASEQDAEYPPLTKAENSPDESTSTTEEKTCYPKLNKPETAPSESAISSSSNQSQKAAKVSNSNNNVTYSNVEKKHQPASTQTISQKVNSSTANVKTNLGAKHLKKVEHYKKMNKKVGKVHKNNYVKSKKNNFNSFGMAVIRFFYYLLK